jgi:hypothetical protein
MLIRLTAFILVTYHSLHLIFFSKKTNCNKINAEYKKPTLRQDKKYTGVSGYDFPPAMLTALITLWNTKGTILLFIFTFLCIFMHFQRKHKLDSSIVYLLTHFYFNGTARKTFNHTYIPYKFVNTCTVLSKPLNVNNIHVVRKIVHSKYLETM